MKLKTFQSTAIEQLQDAFQKLYRDAPQGAPIVFKSPTGSGKTVMMAELIRQLSADNLHLDADLAFMWISFSPESYEQSKRSLYKYYDDGAAGIHLRDMNDIQRGKLKRNEVFFINWQKLNSKSRENKKLHREGESAISFETFVQNTKEDDRKIVLIIDEAHLVKDTDLSGKTIQLIDPKIIFEVSATPKREHIPSREDEDDCKAAFVRVKREDVIAEGLIKEKIEIMPLEDVQKQEIFDRNRETNEIILDLAQQKREELLAKYKELGRNINPLVLIQIPNKTKADAATGKDDFEEIKRYLMNKGVAESRIALWFDNNKENLNEITLPYSGIEYLIFKQAAATGWDCPRAQVLAMLRNIEQETFAAQVLGRVLRMPEAKHYGDPLLDRAYAYSAFKRSEVLHELELARHKGSIGDNRPSIYEAKRSLDPELVLPSIHLGRYTYGDLGDSFQKTLQEVANKHFKLQGNETTAQATKKLEAKGVDTNPPVENDLIVNAGVDCYDTFLEEITQEGEDVHYELTYHDVARLYDLVCFDILNRQEEEKRKYAPAKSWGKMKSAINVWLKNYGFDDDQFYRFVFADLAKKDTSELAKMISKALEVYYPIRQKEIQKRAERREEKMSFQIPEEDAFTDEYELIDGKRCIMQPCYFPKKKSRLGSEPERKFIQFLEKSDIKWWYKNGDSGRNSFAIKYKHPNGEMRTFHPDFLVKTAKNIYLFEIKSADDASAGSLETIAKAEALQVYIAKNTKLKLKGGIVIESGGQWRMNDSKKYAFNKKDLQGWSGDIF